MVRDKEGHYIGLKGLIHQNITFTNTYAPNTRTPKCKKEILLQLNGEVNYNSIIVDLNIPLTPLDRSCKQKDTRSQ